MVDLSSFTNIAYARVAGKVLYIQADNLSLITHDNQIIGITKEFCESLGSKVSTLPAVSTEVTLRELKLDYNHKLRNLAIVDEDFIYSEESKYCYIDYKVFHLTFSVRPKPVNRGVFFLECLGSKDPFKNYWIIRKKENFPIILRSIADVEDNMSSILDFYKTNPRTPLYRRDYLNQDHGVSGGLDRRVYISKYLDVVYKVNKEEQNNGQHLKEILVSFVSNNPFNPPLLSVFTEGGKVVLVFPKLDPATKDDPNQTNSLIRISYLQQLAKSKSFCFSDNRDLLTYEGILMYRGSQPWYYRKGVPMFYDLGECLFEKTSRIDTEVLVSSIDEK